MLIKQRSTSIDLRKNWPRRKRIRLLAALSLLGIVFLVGVFAERQHFAYRAKQLITTDWLTASFNYLTSSWQAPEQLTIDIKHKHYEMLAAWRKTALQRNQITSDLKQYVPANVRFGDRRLEANLRLKGEWVDHVTTDKWSFRIKLKGEQRLFGLKRFSIQHPGTRSFIDEWLYHRALSHEGVAALRYRFVNVVVNGRDLGLYALEEHFAKQMIENNERREGVIVRFDADLRYHPFAIDFGSRLVKVPGLLRTTVKAGIGSQHAATVVAYDEEKLLLDEQLAEQWKTAYNLLQGFRDGELSTHEVFDTEILARYFAISELMGALWTADDWSDMRFLYNPITSRLEPISVEGSEYKPISSLMGAKYTNRAANPHDLHTLIFSDPVFLSTYQATLERVSDPGYLELLLTEFGADLKKQTQLLHREWPLMKLSQEVFVGNAKVIRALLSPAKAVQAFETKLDEKQVIIEVGAIQPLPVEITGLSVGGERLTPREKVVLPGIPEHDRADFQQIVFDAPVKSEIAPTDAVVDDSLLIHCRLLGTSTEQTLRVIRHPRFDSSGLETNLTRLPGNLDSFSFLEIEASTRKVTIPIGDWEVDRTLVIPAGYQVYAAPGARIRLANHANFVSYSPLQFRGTVEAPIVIESQPGSTGQGVFVLNTTAQSTLDHVSFRNLSEPRQAGWELTGAVTFYQADVVMRNCEFLGNVAEDSLNLVQSKFTLTRCSFADAMSDALDADFTTGEIRHCAFANITGDALDFSASEIQLDDVVISNVADKGISVGESSHVRATEVHVDGAKIGMAVKDWSTARCATVELIDCEIGLTLFQKKPEYGPARMTVDSAKLTNVAQHYLVEKNCELMVAGEVIAANGNTVAELLYPAEPAAALP